MSNHTWFLDYHYKGKTMPVPTWDCPELGLLDEPLDTATVVSEDIWKKFDLDFPQAFSAEQYHTTIEDGILPSSGYDPYDRTTTYGYEKSLSSSRSAEAGEIRHHDCMWAGLCISKEHNRTHPAKKDVQIHKKVPAGRSLLINRKPTNGNNSSAQSLNALNCTVVKNLESDGDSTRPETPQSCESETDESEDEVPQFRHDSISINEKLSEYLGDVATATNAAPVSEVTGQLVRRTLTDKKSHQRSLFDHHRRNHGSVNEHSRHQQDIQKNYTNNNHTNNTTNIVSLGDHCYHLNQTSSSKKLDHLGVQTPSDSEEEIDVVTFDKPCRPASLPTNPSAADKQHLQNTVTSALKDKSPPRPRGRPPSNAPRKRSAQTDPKPAKRPKHKTYQKRSKIYNNSNNTNGNISSGSSGSSGSGSGSGNSRNLSLERVDFKFDRISGGERNNCTSDFRSMSGGSSSTNDRNNERFERQSHSSGSSSGGSSSSNAKSMQSSTMSRSSSDDEPDTEKRSLHNNMERQRRIELRNSFEELRVLVPEVEMKEKAPKVVILRQAAVYCDMLTEMGQATLATVNELKRRQDRLRTKLCQLRKRFAAAR
ncbi:myc protein isoform X2 [Athalia rosae]|uniref:myc protein isoform X2 n=1 Tax=Athalia rosae TaxID=37344 RepID=UPI002033B0E6|nr:myc protein isoform X2 [Athalia rosae]